MISLLWKTSAETPPPFEGVAYFERSCDPFDPKKIAEAFGKNPEPVNLPESGWMAIDWFENPIGFIPDGTGFKFPKPEFELVKGYFDDGRMFAYPIADCVGELKERHKQEADKRANGE